MCTNNLITITQQILICGICDLPQMSHAFSDNESCNRDPFNWEILDLEEFSDYYLSTDGAHVFTTLAEPTLSDNTTEDSLNYEASQHDPHYFDNWRDTPEESRFATYALPGYAYSAKEVELLKSFRWDLNADLATDKSRNAYVEGFDGFTTEIAYDGELTRKYHARLLNVFRNKQGETQVGSVKFNSTSAQCVKCHKTMTWDADTIDRAGMELITYAIISHGNNHAAKWFTERETFYVLPEAATWSTVKPNLNATSELTNNEAINFLYEHKRYCKASDCTHDHYINVLLASSLASVA